MPSGFSGIWHRITGRYAKVKALNEREALEARQRDRAEKDALILKQLEERQALQLDIRAQRAAAQEELLQLREDVARYQNAAEPDHENRRSRACEKNDEEKAYRRGRRPRARRRRGIEP